MDPQRARMCVQHSKHVLTCPVGSIRLLDHTHSLPLNTPCLCPVSVSGASIEPMNDDFLISLAPVRTIVWGCHLRVIDSLQRPLQGGVASVSPTEPSVIDAMREPLPGGSELSGVLRCAPSTSYRITQSLGKVPPVVVVVGNGLTVCCCFAATIRLSRVRQCLLHSLPELPGCGNER